METRVIKVSKLDAARRQLAVAIELWANEGDPVAVHALAYNAHDLIYDLNKKRNTNAELLYNSSIIRPEYKEELINAFRKPGNFFKHGDRDPHGIVDFVLASNEMFLIFAIAGIPPLGEALNIKESVFQLWLILNRPTWFSEQYRILSDSIDVQGFKYLNGLSKKNFFIDATEAFIQSGRFTL